MDLIQENGQPTFGRFQELPTSIDISRYHYLTPIGKRLSDWRKHLHYKKFKFCSIQHDDYTIGLSITDLGWAGHCFVYIYHHATGDLQDWYALQPFGRKMHLDEQPQYNQSYFEKSPFQIKMQHANGVRYIHVSKYGEIKLSARIFCAGTDPLSLCVPNGNQRWIYTQKLTTLAVEGFFVNKLHQRVEFNQYSLASLDDTCGFARPEQQWCWLSSSFWLSEDVRIGLNLTSGKSQAYGNENVLWVNGRIYLLDDLQFKQLDEHTWQVDSQDHQLQLTISTFGCREEKRNLRMVGSQFQQWQARVSGCITGITEQPIQLQAQYALFEHHSIKA